MRRIKTISSLVTVASLAMVGVGVTTANAAQSGSTTATFSITAGSLSITVPGNGVVLGSAVATGAATAGGSLGTVAVNDARGALPAAWVTTVTTSSFLNTTPATAGSPTAAETVAPGAISYASGVVGATGTAAPTGSGVGGAGTAAVIGDLGTTAASLTAGVGINTASWTPTISFSLPTTQIAGTYAGTITHSLV